MNPVMQGLAGQRVDLPHSCSGPGRRTRSGDRRAPGHACHLRPVVRPTETGLWGRRPGRPILRRGRDVESCHFCFARSGFSADSHMITPKYARLAWRYLWRRLFTVTGPEVAH